MIRDTFCEVVVRQGGFVYESPMSDGRRYSCAVRKEELNTPFLEVTW